VVVIVVLLLVVNGLRGRRIKTGSAAFQTTTVQHGTLTSTVEGTGTVRSSLSANLAWLTSGQVDQVNARIGDQVKTGDVLASLLQGSTQSTLESNLVTAQQNLAQLTSPEAIANAKLAVANAQADVINAQSALNNNQYWKNDALIRDYYAKLVIARTNLENAQNAYDRANVGQYINNSGEAALYQSLYNAQQAYNLAQYYYSLYSQKPTQRQTDQAQATLDVANAALKNAQDYLTVLTGGDVPATATGADLLKLNQAKLAVQTAQEALDAVKITAPFAGTITQSNAVSKAVVSPGTQAFRIDDMSNLVIDVQVVEVDINHVKVGQPATITFDAIPNKTYNSKVIKTDLAWTESQNSVNFTVTVQLTDADALVKPGMAANVTIVSNKVADALLVPSTSIFSDPGGGQFVYLVRNGVPTMLPVTVGAVSDSTTQITGGNLKAGDTIVLSFASSAASAGGFGFRLGGGGAGQAVRAQPVSGGKPQPVSTP
jgi:HlyD family secretion protein